MLRILFAWSLLPAVVMALPGDGGEKKPDPFVDRIVAFKPGEGAGYGQDRQPEIILGPPHGGGRLARTRVRSRACVRSIPRAWSS